MIAARIFLLILAVCVPEALAQPPAGLPEALLAEVQRPKELPPGRYIEAGAWEAEGAIGRRGGRVVDDPEAQGGKAWEVQTPAADQSGSATLFGPYVELPAGTYVAFFRIKLLGDEIDTSVAGLDATVSTGRTRLSDVPLGVADLVRGRYVQVPLGFVYHGGKLECRVHWSGLASLRVDRVALYRLEGASLGALTSRVADPRPSGLPRDLTELNEPRPYPDVFPRSKAPARRLLVVDLKGLPPDWRLCLMTLQGIVNRTQPEVYCLVNPTDEQWLDWMRTRGWIETTERIAPAKLVERYRDRLQGAAVFDPALPATKHVATMLSGLDDLLAVSPRLAAELKLPIRQDLRGRFATSVEAYRWALQFWPRMNHHLVACCWPDSVGSFDYFVQHRAFIFWMSGRLDGARRYARPDEEVQFVEQLLARMPANTAVMGFPWAGDEVGIGEGAGVSLCAEFAKYFVGAVDCSNLSVHSGVPVGTLRQQPSPAVSTLDAGKVYVAPLLSDGDNLPVLTVHNFPQYWKDAARGTFPLGWTISPSASLLLPDVVDYYYRTASPQDCFLAAVSGVGYTYPDSYASRYREDRRGAIFDGFLEQTRLGMQRGDLHLNWIMNATRPELIRRYAERIPQTEAIFPDYGRVVAGYAEATYPTARNVGVFHAVNNWKEGLADEEQIARTVEQVRAFTPRQRPAFLHLFAWNWGYKLPMIREVLRRLGPDYVAVRPDHLSTLYQGYLARERVLFTLPALVPAIEGLDVTWSGRVQNTSSSRQGVEFAVSGVQASRVTPASAALESADSVSLTISGRPTGGPLGVDCRGAGVARHAEIACTILPQKEIVGELPKQGGLQFETQYAAVQLSHRSGRNVSDPQAGSREAWQAEPGRDEHGYIVFGPYRHLPPGKYLVLFRLKRLGGADGEFAVVDTAVEAGRSTGSVRCKAEQFPVGQYRYAALTVDHPGGKIETRVLWPGKAAVAIDSITLWRR